jgi:hypothetical protein
MRLAHYALACAASLCACVWPASRAFAGFTNINQPYPGEESHGQIFSAVYGGSFTRTGLLSLDFTNGVITAIRIDDFVDPEPDRAPQFDPHLIVVGDTGGDDQTWLANYRVASAEAKFAMYSQNFGYFEGASGGSYVKLFDQTGQGYTVGGDADLSRLAGQVLRWGRGGEGRIFSSKPSDNSDSRDHMVTYRIEGLAEILGAPAGLTTWLMFWEDKFKNEEGADFDFNDLVVEVQALPIPEPASAGLLLLACTSTVLGRSRRARRGRC